MIEKITEDGYLDTTSPIAIEKFKHNLSILINKAKRERRIDKFMLIRDDNFFPIDYEWSIASKNTGIEKIHLPLTLALKEQYALENSGLVNKSNGLNIPVPHEKINDALKKVDPYFGAVYFPIRFRSTKHFTINTPLEVTGNYNWVDTNRNFTIIDTIDNFLSSGYAYSISYHDAYLDVSHEPLQISDSGIVLMEESKYKKVIENPVLKSELNKRRLIVYKGEEYLAIDMLLTELGVLPSQVGFMYREYDAETKSIIEDSIQSLANDYNLFYDKNHSGINGHFSSIYDGDNGEYNEYIEKFVNFLKSKFPKYSNLITPYSIKDERASYKLVESIGVNPLMKAIEEYNSIMEKEIAANLEKYKNERKKITPEISRIFKITVRRIDDYFKNNESVPSEFKQELDRKIHDFFQADNVEEQLNASKSILLLIQGPIEISPKLK